MTHGGKLPEIAQMLTETTGRAFQHQEVYNLVKKLQKQFLLTDTATVEEEEVEIQGLEVPAQWDKALQVGNRPYYGRRWRLERLES